MSGSPDGQNEVKAGPELPDTVDEVHGRFATDAALEDAIGRLTRSGFDRADLSLPTINPPPAERTPEQGATNPNTDDDKQQMRTLHASMAGSIAAVAAAGVVVATGGAALPAVAAAAAAGLASGGLMEAVTRTGDAADRNAREAAAQRGELVLSVRVTTSDSRLAAERLLREAGAQVPALQSTVRATDGSGGINSSGWTG
jgi:hypothetical protein